MDRTEKLQYEKGIEQYFDDHKVYGLFERLLKELIVNKPEDPVSYLIERLKTPTIKRIFITGNSGTNRKSIGLSLANSLDYKCFNMNDILEREINKKQENAHKIEKNYNQHTLVDDEIVINLVKDQLINYEKENLSYVVEGFPRNREQAIFLQSTGILPDNIIILTSSREKEEQQIFNKLREKIPKQNNTEENNENQEHSEVDSEQNGNNAKTDEQIKIMAKISADQSDMNLRAVEDVFKGFYCEINVDNYSKESEVVDELANLLKFKQKTNSARRPPRIILVSPPCFNKTSILDKIAKHLRITGINIMDLLKKEIGNKNENSKAILDSLEKGELVNDKYLLKLLEDRLSSADCMVNGWILTGFPQSIGQINYIESMQPEIKPSLIAVIDSDEKTIEEKAKKIKYDPKTGQIYRIDSKKYKNLSQDILNRLISRKQDQPDLLKKRINSWKIVNDNLLSQKNCLKLSGDEKKKKLVQLIIDAVGYNS